VTAERLQKVLARAGVASRRKVEEMIAAGRVTVNGEVASLGDKADPAVDHVKLDGKRIEAAHPHKYLLLNKPRAVMSTREDPEGRPTVLELVPARLRKALVPVGRLDFLTEGLLLLTDDGELAQRVAHPRYGCTKTYEVKVRGTPDERKVDRLRRGIPIDGKRTRPAKIDARAVPGESENSWWTVELTEGRTRQLREMFQRVGHPVMKLRRVAIGPVRDPGLPPGAVRELTAAEVESLRRVGRKGRPAGGKGKGQGATRDRSGWAKAAPKPKTGKPKTGKKRSGGPSPAEAGAGRGPRGGGAPGHGGAPEGRGGGLRGRGGGPGGRGGGPRGRSGAPAGRGGGPGGRSRGPGGPRGGRGGRGNR